MSTVRSRILFMLCLLAMITYLDRVCFGTAAPEIARDLGLSGVADLKWAFSAFALAYAIFEVPTGWLGDVLGPRRTLIRVVLWWSLFTVLTGLVGLRIAGVVLGGSVVLVVVRLLFGAGEAGAFPNITRALRNWFPVDEWSRAQGFIWMSGRLMGGLTPLLWAVLVSGTPWTHGLVDWRGAFLLFGLVGVAWCIVFARSFHDRPVDHPGISPGELARIDEHRPTDGDHLSVRWSSFFRSGNLWLLCLMYGLMAYGWYFNITYLPSFLEERFGVERDSLTGAIYKGGPLWVGAIGCLAGGALADGLIQWTGNRRLARRMLGVASQLMCAAAWIWGLSAQSAFEFFVAVSLAAFCNDLTLASSWATCQEVGGRFTAVTAAIMNTAGSLGAAAAGLSVGLFLDRAAWSRARELETTVAQLSPKDALDAQISGYHVAFVSFAIIYLISAALWCRIDCTRPIQTDGSD